MIEWRFKPNSRDDMDVDPIQGEFFTTRDIDNVSTAVVREGIQNALDERNRGEGSETVKVRIALSGNKYSLPPELYKPLLEQLEPHLLSKNSGIQTPPSFKEQMKFLIFEDFNTKGLEGAPDEYYLENNNDGQPHNFYYFWRNVGRSGKSDDKLGRWGLGKTVFPASSQINTFWGLTVRKNDKRKLLMGQSILRIHNLEGHHKVECGFRPYGVYGKYIDNGYFAMPIEKDQCIEVFEQMFRLDRRDNPGLSIIIPFVTEEINIDYLAYSVIEQYFYPILEGKLVVQLEFEDEIISLEKHNLRQGIEKINFDLLNNSTEKKIRSKESLYKLFEFAQWTFQLRNEDFFQLKELDLTLIPRWNKSLFQPEDLLELYREKFDSGNRVAFKVPLKYHPINGSPKTCWFDAFLEKDVSLSKPENLFVREGITISGITSLEKGLVRGIVIIHDIDLARMLGDSENPAHTEWQPDSRNFKGKYVQGKEALVFIKSTLRKIFDRLQKPIEGVQKDLLVDFFSIPIEASEEKREKRLPRNEPGEDEVIEPDVPNIDVKKRAYLIEKIPTGLKLTRNPKANAIPESMKLKLGYDVPRGNPVASYQEPDFDVSKRPINIESVGVYFTTKEKNVLEFEIENADQFEITLTGFDEKRDLFIKLQ